MEELNRETQLIAFTLVLDWLYFGSVSYTHLTLPTTPYV